MPWSNAWSGGGIVVASEVLVENNGNVVAFVDSQGNISGENVYASNSLYYKGTELQSLLDAKSQGAVAQGVWTMPVFSNFSAETVIGGLKANIVNGRMYSFKAFDLSWNNVTTAFGNGAIFLLRDENFNEMGRWPVMANGFDNRAQFTVPILTTPTTTYPWGTTGQHLFQLSVAAAGSNISTYQNVVKVELVDEGLQPNDTGYASSPPASTYKTFQVNALDSQSFIGSGAASNGSGVDNGDIMYFGEDPGYPPNGNWKSLAWFDKNATGGGSYTGTLNDMAGIAASAVDYLDVYVYTPWWYSTSGGTLVLGYTTSTIDHSSYPGGVADQLRVGFSARNTGQWISVLGTGIESAILAGSYGFGIQLGPGPDTSYAWYGYASGADHYVPQIRGGYWK